ncbi:hypothetical protein KAFR_0G01070 [Kazachstania africana CBS 2517]|uniref:Lethal giant larvae (Lgl)-like C-terminal domain-containing protein n=1 Tax=Kazachstania africana (strain ATCC 22294 / BCRC 22015 / CBS 2517 / CECT 1963 / NBRC 1671 / NRRL Y-8276) TaxID=1071382 RepID=H2AXP0_KAZAF|nr:hypothetical protein KAFR_0G01070 [Kazachstania africana CBS 2517]CCF59140.1 hypothetical protein KAFR_0G01070 [Kazachstania africana CBS 2517]
MFKGNRLKGVSNPFKSSSSTSPATSPVLKSSESKLHNPFKSSPASRQDSTFKAVSQTFKSADSKLFDPRDIQINGVNGRIVCSAFDFSQSLLAVATDTGDIHVFGQKQTDVVFNFGSKIPISHLKFVKGIYLVAIDSKDSIMIISLYSKTLLTTVFPPSKITCVECDPSLDWIILGLQSGTIVIYDVDRDVMSDISIENLQKSYYFPKERLSPVISINWNPRDVGTLLISYGHVTVTYSLLDMEVVKDFIYKLPPYAPGGDASARDIDRERIPRVMQSLYHPNSLHILTVHEDNSLVFWDANTGKLIGARTLFDTDVNLPQNDAELMNFASDTSNITNVSWICQNNAEHTALIIATRSERDNTQGLTIIELGGTPLYSITSYDQMKKYYFNPKQQKISLLVDKSKLLKVMPIPKASPYFGGCHDPTFILLLFESGELETMLYPSASFTSKSSLFPPCLSWATPLVSNSMALSVPSKLWLGMMSAAAVKEGIVKGGSPAKKPMRTQTTRSALLTGHSNGSVRICDASSKELDDNAMFEINIGRILNRAYNISIGEMSLAPETLELAVASELGGEVVLFKFEVNKFYNDKNVTDNLNLKLSRFSINDINDTIIDVRDRAPHNVKQGFMPNCIVNAKQGTVTALKNSNIGFVGIAYSTGTVLLLDRRGPAVIYMENLRNISRIRSLQVTSIEFSIMEYGEDGYSSILMLCGTDVGELLIYKILPERNGRFCVEFIEATRTNNDSPIIKIEAFAKESGYSCEANILKMQELSKGIPIPGYVITTARNDVRLTKLGRSKVSHKTFKYPAVASSLMYIPGSSERKTLMPYFGVLLSNGGVKVYSIPDVREVKAMQLPTQIHSKYIRESSFLKNGDIYTRTNTFKSILLSVVNDATNVGSNPRDQTPDTLYNPNLKIPYRPQVNSLQWARGTVYCTPAQLDMILGGERRAESKYKESLIARGTLTLKPKGDKNGIEEPYKKPIRHTSPRTGAYGVFKNVSRTVETTWDSLETQMNDYATAMGQSMNDMMEETGKDIVKGSLGI